MRTMNAGRVKRLGRLLGAAAVLAGLLATASGAQAASPQLGRCVKTAPGAGAYSSASCTKATVGGSYEWLPGAAKAGFTVAATKPLLFEAGPEQIICQSASGHGSYSGANAVTGLVVTYNGCTFTAFGHTLTCQNTGTAGEIVSDPMQGGYGVITANVNPKKDKLGLDAAGAGPGGEILHYVCGISSNDVIGSVIVPVKSNKMLTAAKLTYKQASSHQIPEAFEGMPRDVLERQIEPGVFEQTGISAKFTLTNEEPLEINSVL
jgi:hypothetical protein